MKVRIMSSRYVPYMLGYPYDTMILYKELLKFVFWLILKIILSTDYSLQLGYMKEELLVIVYHNKTVNFFLICVQTARQALKVNNYGIYWD